MENAIIFRNLINGYNELSFTHKYMFGFEDHGTIYCAIANSDVLPYVCILDKASRGCGFSLRFKPNRVQKEFLKTCKLIAVCSKEFFENSVRDSKYNRGEIFEKLMTEYFGQVWEKDNVPFTQAGDIVVESVHYQIKFEKATFTNESTLLKMRSVA